MNEPYNAIGKMGIVSAFFALIIAWWLLGLGYGIMIFLLILGGSQVWPLFVDSARWRGNRITIGGLGTFSCLSLEALNHTADDPEGKAPGKLLYAFGGGGPRWTYAWRDGGTKLHSGGYIQVPNDCPVNIAPDHLYLPVVPMRVSKENYSEHFQATVEEHGFNPQYTNFYTADLSLISLIPASDKSLDQEALKESKNALLSEHRDLTADFTGHQATQMDLWKQVRDVVEPRKRGIIPKRQEPPEEESQNGD